MPFTLSPKDLKDFAPDMAVSFFRHLLWAEASRVGVGRHLISVPDCINVGDGGIDAYIEDAKPSFDDLIPDGTTGFQVKSADMQPQKCKRELHEGYDPNAPIKPEIKRILDAGGNYVLVLYADIPSDWKKRRETAIRVELDSLGYYNPIRVYTVDQLVEFANQFISLVTWLIPPLRDSLPYESWAKRSDILSPRRFVYDEERKKWVDEIRTQLRAPGNACPIFRVTGLSGIGKTRLVFEALSPNDLSNRVVYISADHLYQSQLYQTLQNEENRSAILVIDECDLMRHEEFTRAFSERGSRLAILTLSQDIGNVHLLTKLINLGPLGQDEIKTILQGEYPELPVNVIQRINEFSDGYPKIAVLLSDSYLHASGSPDEFIRINDDLLFNRLIGGEIASDWFRKNKRVLTGISLFQKVGYEGPVSDESKWMAKEFLKIDWHEFLDIVSEQKKRGILQGQYSLFVAPFMLRVHLLTQWWEQEGFTEETFNKILSTMPENLRGGLVDRFFDHIPFVSTTERGKHFVESILSEEGVFSDGSLLTSQIGANFFLKLSEADSQSALQLLKRTVGTWDKDQLLQFTTGRRLVIYALTHIVTQRNLFPDGARLLLALGEAENETWANNASGVFADLFSPAPGRVAPTAASPQERFPIIKEALEADSKERRILALRACERALTTYYGGFVIPPKPGLRTEPELWEPKTYGELFDAYRMVWNFLRESIDSLPKDEQQRAIGILVQNSRSLGIKPSLAKMVTQTLGELAQRVNVDKNSILHMAIQVFHYHGKDLLPEVRQLWEDLRDSLSGKDYYSLLRRYVGTSFLEDKFDAEGNPITDQIQPQVEKLAAQSVKQPHLLEPELEWLVTTEAQNGYTFGHALGRADKDFTMLPVLIEAQRNAGENPSPLFLAGYFRVIFEKDKTKWEKVLDALAQDVNLCTTVPEITWRSGISDRAATRVIALAEVRAIDIASLRIFGLGSVLDSVSSDIYNRWLEFLLESSKEYAISIALDLHHFYYGRKKERRYPEEMTLRLLTHPALFLSTRQRGWSTMDEFYWTEISKSFVILYPESSLEIADLIIQNFGKEGTIIQGFYSTTHPVLGKIAQEFPREIWKRISTELGPPLSSQAFHLKEWLRGSDSLGEVTEGALSLFPLDAIWTWVDDDIENRAWYIASFVPKILFRENGNPCLAREVLIR